MIARLLATPTLVAAAVAAPMPALAAGASGPPPEAWSGCPANAVLETTPDPRFAQASVGTSAATSPRLVVRCVSRSAPTVPLCPSLSAIEVAAGSDRCVTGRSRSTSNPLPDGTSNVPMIGETRQAGSPSSRMAEITDGSSNTLTVGEARHTGSTSATMGDGSVRMITDGSSNTIMIGEAQQGSSATNGEGSGRSSSSTVASKGGGQPASAPQSFPASCKAPAVLVIDVEGGKADACVTTTYTAPSYRVMVTPPSDPL